MWPFSRGKEADGIGDRLTTALRRLDDLESGQRMLKTEWLDTLDRLERIAGRLAKRAERADKADDGAASPAPPGTGAVVGRVPLNAQQRIALRRGH